MTLDAHRSDQRDTWDPLGLERWCLSQMCQSAIPAPPLGRSPFGGRSLLSPDLARVAITSDTQLIASRGAGRLATGFPPNVLRTDQEGTITLPM